MNLNTIDTNPLLLSTVHFTEQPKYQKWTFNIGWSIKLHLHVSHPVPKFFKLTTSAMAVHSNYNMIKVRKVIMANKTVRAQKHWLIKVEERLWLRVKYADINYKSVTRGKILVHYIRDTVNVGIWCKFCGVQSSNIDTISKDSGLNKVWCSLSSWNGLYFYFHP